MKSSHQRTLGFGVGAAVGLGGILLGAGLIERFSSDSVLQELHERWEELPSEHRVEACSEIRLRGVGVVFYEAEPDDVSLDEFRGFIQDVCGD